MPIIEISPIDCDDTYITQSWSIACRQVIDNPTCLNLAVVIASGLILSLRTYKDMEMEYVLRHNSC